MKRQRGRVKQVWVLTLIAASLYYTGLVRLLLWWRRRKKPSLIILDYHQASGGDLRRHLLYLRRHYRVLPLVKALEELYSPCRSNLEKKDRRIPVVLTFDDGYQDNYTHAFRLACELQLPITLFLVPGYVESGHPFWWLEAERLVALAQVDEVIIEDRRYRLDKSHERKAFMRAIDDRLRYASSVAEREGLLHSFRKALAVSSTLHTEEEQVAASPLTWAQVQEMEESGWVSFGAHTMHHPILGYIADPAEVQYEVTESRKVLEEQLKHSISTFAYPVGLLQHIGEHGIRAVEQARFDWALTTMFGFNTPQTHPLVLRRIVVDTNQHWTMLAVKVSGLWSFFARPCWKLINFLWKGSRTEHYSW